MITPRKDILNSSNGPVKLALVLVNLLSLGLNPPQNTAWPGVHVLAGGMLVQ